MKKILVPCDFSVPAINAFRLALNIASKGKGRVQLLNVIEVPVLHDTMLMPTLSFEEALLKELREKAEREFAALVEKYNTHRVDVEARIEFGPTARTILKYAEREDVALIIMGSHGISGIREVFIGSNAEKIVRKASVPVLITKHNTTASITDIVFPNTLELEDQEDLMMRIKELQHFFQAKLHLLWVNTPLNFASDLTTYDRLHAFAKRFMLRNYDIHVFNHPTTEEGILKFAELKGADLIAMATHGRTGVAHLMNGSIAEDVANHTERLVWTYRLKKEQVAEA